MKPTVYIETTIVSYLTARPSHDLASAARQTATRDWWDNRRVSFGLYCSQLVINEASRGDPEAAKRRLNELDGIPLLELSESAFDLARALVEGSLVPKEYPEDAAHIAVATMHGMDYLLTWNYAHIANAQVRRRIERHCSSIGLELPTICTPDELMED